MNRAAVAAAPDGCGLNPVGTVLRCILFEKVFLIDPAGIALHRERAARQMRDENGCNTHVVVDHLAFGESRSRIENLVEIGEAQAAAFDVDYGGCGHKAVVRSSQVGVRISLSTAVADSELRATEFLV